MTIGKFWAERAWHTRLGVVYDPRPVPDRPWKEVEEYEVIMTAETAHENRSSAAPRVDRSAVPTVR